MTHGLPLLLTVLLAAIAGCSPSAARPPIPANLKAPEAVAVVVPVARSPQPPAVISVVRPVSEWTASETAADALRHMGPAPVHSLVVLLHDPDPALRIKAAQILAALGPAAKEAVPPLRAALRDSDPDVQKWAARALGQIGPDAAEAVPDLVETLRAGK